MYTHAALCVRYLDDEHPGKGSKPTLASHDIENSPFLLSMTYLQLSGGASGGLCAVQAAKICDLDFPMSGKTAVA